MKHNLHKIILLSIILSATSCAERLDISDNERLLVKGTLVDDNGSPIPNISILTNAANKIMASAKSDASGYFEFTSLNASNDSFMVLVNIAAPYTSEVENAFYSGKIYFSEAGERDPLLNLGTVTLKGVSTFSIFLKNLPGDENFITYTLSYSSNICKVPLNANGNDFCELDITQNNTLNPTSETRTIERNSILSSIAFFEYSLNGEPAQTIEIPVTNPPTTYVFEY